MQINDWTPRLLQCKLIDLMQKWLPLNYSFVHIQNSLTNLVPDNKFFTIFVSKTRLVRLFKHEQENNIKAAIFV